MQEEHRIVSIRMCPLADRSGLYQRVRRWPTDFFFPFLPLPSLAPVSAFGKSPSRLLFPRLRLPPPSPPPSVPGPSLSVPDPFLSVSTLHTYYATSNT